MKENHHINNTKFVLIILVVFGHLLEALLKHNIISDLYRVLYVFHIPAFIFLAGLTAKAKASKKDYLGLLVILVLFQLAYVALYTDFQVSYLFQPYWLLWFVLSLFFWRIILPFFYKLKYPLFIATIISLLSGMIANLGYEFSLSRTFVFLPFFIAGHFYGSKILAWLSKRKAFSKVAIIITGLLAIVATSTYIHDILWFYGSQSYQLMNTTNTAGMLTRFLQLAAAGLGCLMIFAIIPTKQYSWSKLGRRTLSVYLLHGFFVINISPLISNIGNENIWMAMMSTIILAILLSYLLSMKVMSDAIYKLYKLSFKS